MRDPTGMREEGKVRVGGGGTKQQRKRSLTKGAGHLFVHLEGVLCRGL